MAAAPVYEQDKMVQISPTASHQDWTQKGEFMFRVVATQSCEGPYNARWAVSDLKKKKIATIYINNDWGVDANKYFTGEARRLGAEILAEEAFTPGEKDFNAIISKLKRLEPDLVYMPTFYADFTAIMNQADRARFKPTVPANSSLFSVKTLEMGGKAVEGTMIPVNYFGSDPRPAAQTFTKEYKALYGAGPGFPLALVVALAATALLGIAVELLAFHFLRNAPHATSLPVTIGISILLVNPAQTIRAPETQAIPFGRIDRLGHFEIEIGGVCITFLQIAVPGVTLLLMPALYFIINRTKLGMVIRATAS
jgi:hypothetical protein